MKIFSANVAVFKVLKNTWFRRASGAADIVESGDLIIVGILSPEHFSLLNDAAFALADAAEFKNFHCDAIGDCGEKNSKKTKCGQAKNES